MGDQPSSKQTTDNEQMAGLADMPGVILEAILMLSLDGQQAPASTTSAAVRADGVTSHVSATYDELARLQAAQRRVIQHPLRRVCRRIRQSLDQGMTVLRDLFATVFVGDLSRHNASWMPELCRRGCRRAVAVSALYYGTHDELRDLVAIPTIRKIFVRAPCGSSCFGHPDVLQIVSAAERRGVEIVLPMLEMDYEQNAKMHVKLMQSPARISPMRYLNLSVSDAGEESVTKTLALIRYAVVCCGIRHVCLSARFDFGIDAARAYRHVCESMPNSSGIPLANLLDTVTDSVMTLADTHSEADLGSGTKLQQIEMAAPAVLPRLEAQGRRLAARRLRGHPLSTAMVTFVADAVRDGYIRSLRTDSFDLECVAKVYTACARMGARVQELAPYMHTPYVGARLSHAVAVWPQNAMDFVTKIVSDTSASFQCCSALVVNGECQISALPQGRLRKVFPAVDTLVIRRALLTLELEALIREMAPGLRRLTIIEAFGHQSIVDLVVAILGITLSVSGEQSWGATKQSRDLDLGRPSTHASVPWRVIPSISRAIC